MNILASGYEEVVRSKLGVDEDILPDNAIGTQLVAGLAEAVVKRKVPDFASITDDIDGLYLQNAVVSYICYLLAPTMPNRIKIEVSTLDVKWKQGRVDWEKRAEEYLMEFESSLMEITTVPVTTVNVPIFTRIIGGRPTIGEW